MEIWKGAFLRYDIYAVRAFNTCGQTWMLDTSRVVYRPPEEQGVDQCQFDATQMMFGNRY
jgi:hypothetical protein